MRFRCVFAPNFCLGLPLLLVRDPHPRCSIQNLLEPATQPNARMHVFSSCAGYTQPGGPKRSMRGAVVLHNRQMVSPPSPSHIPPSEPLHHSNGSHRPGSNFRRISCRNTLFCSFWGYLDSMRRLDIQTGCSDTDFGRNIKRWSHSERAFPSTSRRHFGGGEETFFSTLENFSEL